MKSMRLSRTVVIRSIALPSIFIRALITSLVASKSTRSIPVASTTDSKMFKTHPYIPRHKAFPYTARDFLRQDELDDTDFYSQPRFVTHIDDNAISLLRSYYAANLPRKGRILDLCSSWVSHFPKELEELALAGKGREEEKREGMLEVMGLGMNQKELAANRLLNKSILQNLNVDPTIPATLTPLDATSCVVSIDYLTKPLDVLQSLRERTREGGSVHLIISNRCFPTKAVGRWLRISEQERLRMVGDYLHFSGWKEIEIVEVCDGSGTALGLMGMFGVGVDPLWVVRGVRIDGQEGVRSEL